jgi:hypothetical protein
MTRGKNRDQGRSSAFSQLAAGVIPKATNGLRDIRGPTTEERGHDECLDFILRGLQESVVSLRDTGFVLASCGEFEEVGFANHASAGAQICEVELAAELAEELSIRVADNACEASTAHQDNISRAHIQRLLG